MFGNTEIGVCRRLFSCPAGAFFSHSTASVSVAHFLHRHRSPQRSAPPSAERETTPERRRHKKNEIFLDVVEKLNLLVSATGNVLRSEILGSAREETKGG